MSKKEWPFRPDHITNDGPWNTENPELQRLNGNGIISNEYLAGIQTTIANVLNNPTAILEFPPQDSNCDPVTTVPKSQYYKLKRPCLLLRKHLSDKFCHECDVHHANLFRYLKKNDIPKLILERTQKNPYISKYVDDGQFTFSLKENRERNYLEYDCPNLGLRELIFPINVEDRIVGLLYVGGIYTEGKKEFLINTATNIYKSYSDLYIENSENNLDNSANNFLKDYSEWLDDYENCITKTDYQVLIQKACIELSYLEDTLKREMQRLRELYVNAKVKWYITSFVNEIRNVRSGIPLGDEGIRIFWKIVEKCYREIVEDFKVSHAIIFGSDRFTKKYSSKLPAVVSVGDISSPDLRTLDSLQYDLNQISDYAKQSLTHSRKEPRLFRGLQELNLDNNTNFIRIFPPPISMKNSIPENLIVTWIRYNNSKWNPFDEIDKESGYVLEKAIRPLYDIFSSTISAIRAETTKMNMENALKIIKHESSQLIAGIDIERRLKLSEKKVSEGLSNKDARIFSEDLDGFIKQIIYVFKQPDALITELKLEKSRFSPYQVISKWKNMKNRDAMIKNLQLSIPYPSKPYDQDRPYIMADKNLFEQIVYNLLNNAIKYCHRGTKIHMDCKVDTNIEGKPVVLSISNFGSKVNDTEDIYKLFWRDPNLKSYTTGLGIGLFIAKKIAEVHGGQIWAENDIISEYYIPLLEGYMNTQFEGKDEKLEDYATKELIRLKDKDIYSSVVALDEFGELRYRTPSRLEKINSITEQTWKVTFKVSFPVR